MWLPQMGRVAGPACPICCPWISHSAVVRPTYFFRVGHKISVLTHVERGQCPLKSLRLGFSVGPCRGGKRWRLTFPKGDSRTVCKLHGRLAPKTPLRAGGARALNRLPQSGDGELCSSSGSAGGRYPNSLHLGDSRLG